jgi:cell wall-associated NlpC family hydrolase
VATENPAEAAAERERITNGVVETALGVMGTPYQWGGTDGNGFDCSGLVRFAYLRHGIELPRTSGEQLRSGTEVELRVDALRPGDILGFSKGPEGVSSHVALYLGDGIFVHSSTAGVRLSNFRNPYWQQRFVAARRIVR